MDWSYFRFRTVWDLSAEPDAVYAVLERAEEYPLWWPQVREVTPLNDDTGTARFRSFLPYELLITAHALRRDPAAGVLEIGMEGDLEGWARWTLAACGTGNGARTGKGKGTGMGMGAGKGTRALYEQEVEVRKPLMRMLALPCRPVFRANHAAIMRGGRRGLVAYLDGV